jgi:hypothetical protein
MPVPEQVRKQSEAIARMYAEQGKADGEPTAPTNAEQSAPQEADRSNEQAPAPMANEQSHQGNTDEQTFERRYRTLQGMYNADTARLRSENQSLAARMAQLEQLISTLQTAQPSAPVQTSQSRLVTDKDVEEYGDSIDVMRRVTKEENAAHLNKIAELENLVRQMQNQLVPRVEQVARSQAMSAEQMFWTELSSTVPNWREVNNDEKFHDWLLEVDPLTGQTRQALLEQAQQSLDARRVANFFSSWQTLSGQSVAQPPRNVAASQLERQIAPSKGRTSGAPAAEQPKTYAPGDISKFFDDVRRGVYKGREAERDRIERDIFAAQREGRIL